MSTRLILVCSTVLWFCAVAYGISVMWRYENTPGVAAAPPVSWPTGTRIQRSTENPTLIMFAHPHCPCTRASIGELSAIMAHSQGRLNAYVLFLRPAGFTDNWEKTDTWKSSASIPGVTPLIDYDGNEAHQFHAATSGQTLLYDESGRLLFSGGITGSRGHSGDNAGRSSITTLLNNGAADRTETFVFGCPLFDESSACRENTVKR